jgi:hypothetical protein
MADIESKEGQPIHEGDHVYTKMRGGRHEGDVRRYCLRSSSLANSYRNIGRKDS